MFKEWNMKNSQNNLTVGIIGAMDCEIEKLKSKLKNIQINKAGEITIYTGEIAGLNIILLKSGVGKVNSAVCTQFIADKYSPDCIINTGIAGGIGQGLSVGDIVIGEKLVQYDFDVSAIGYARGYMCTGKDKDKPTLYYSDKKLIQSFEQAVEAAAPELKVHKGTIATGDTFVSDIEKKIDIRDTFNAIAVEMEGCAIAQAATLNKIPFIIIRALSDLADENAAEGHAFVEEEMAELSSKTIQYLLEQIKND